MAKKRNDINVVTIIGTTSKDPEVKTVGNGFTILQTSIANNFLQKNGEEYEQKVSFFDLKILGKMAENLSGFLAKGTRIAVTGELRQDRWTDKNGHQASRIYILADMVNFCGSPQKGSEQRSSQGQEGNSGGYEQPGGYDGNGAFPEDIPF